MKKNLSKLFAMALALIMVMALTVPAMAAGTGSITITNATVGETYAGYKIFDATYSGENVAYTIKSNSQFYGAVSTADDVFTLTESSVTGTYNVALVQDADVLAWVKGLNIEGFTPDLTATEADSDTVAWSSVPYGYYYITSSLGTLITVDSNLPDVSVIDKNQKPGTNPSKTAGDEDYEIGETIPFTVTFTATNYDGETAITEYYVTDTMPDGMELIVDSLSVKVNNNNLVEAYTEKTTTSTAGFDIVIPWQDDEGGFLYTSPSTVTVTYSAKLNSLATIDSTGNKNEATISWNGNTGDSIPVEDTVYTYALAIKKVDKDGNGLAGAEFVLKNGDDVVKVSGSDGNYVVDPNGTATITSPDSGLIIIKGVDGDNYTLTETKAPAGYNLLTSPVTVIPEKIGDTKTSATIYLDEDGNVIDVVEGEPVETPAATVAINIENVAAKAYAVVNFTGTELPSTGGIGTTLFYTIGGVLVVCAGVLLVTKKRMNNMEG